MQCDSYVVPTNPSIATQFGYKFCMHSIAYGNELNVHTEDYEAMNIMENWKMQVGVLVNRNMCSC